MPHTTDEPSFFGVPLKLTDEPLPKVITGDSILSISNGAEEIEMPVRVAAQAPSMYEMLKEIQFKGGRGECDDAYLDICSICDCRDFEGHTPDCRLAAILKAVEGDA